MEILKKPPITKEALENHSVLIIAFPQKKFKEEEITAITDFVNEGGGLFLVGEEWDFNHFKGNLNSVAEKFKIFFNDDEILDPKNKLLDSSEHIGDYYFVLRPFTDHPITKNQHDFVSHGGCSLKLQGECQSVLKGSEYAFSSEKYYDPGQFPPVLAVTGHGRGRVAALGDGSILRDIFINEANNKELVLNILEWLGEPHEDRQEEVREHSIVEDITILERKYAELNTLYSNHGISFEEYQKRLEEFGQELLVLESKMR